MAPNPANKLPNTSPLLLAIFLSLTHANPTRTTRNWREGTHKQKSQCKPLSTPTHRGIRPQAQDMQYTRHTQQASSLPHSSSSSSSSSRSSSSQWWRRARSTHPPLQLWPLAPKAKPASGRTAGHGTDSNSDHETDPAQQLLEVTLSQMLYVVVTLSQMLYYVVL